MWIHFEMRTLHDKNIQSALSSGKIDKYEYLKSKEMFPPDQSRIIEQAKFTKFTFRKKF